MKTRFQKCLTRCLAGIAPLFVGAGLCAAPLTWFPGTALNEPRSSAATVVSPNGRILFFGGSPVGSTDVLVYGGNNDDRIFAQDGNDTVILEGSAQEEKVAERLNQLRKDYMMKYQYTPDWSNELNQIVFRVEPRIVHAWKAPRMHRSLVKFIF